MSEQNKTTVRKPRMKWVLAESRDESECDRMGWKSIAYETRLDGSSWCLWADMEDQP